MSLCKCKICQKKLDLGGEISQLTTRQLQVRLKTQYQISMSLDEIDQHLKFFGLECKPQSQPQKTVKKSVIESVVDEIGKPLVDLDNLDFTPYQKLDPNSPNSISTYIQRIQLYLYLQQCEIVISRINAFKRGEIKRYPTLAVTNLVRLYTLLDRVTGLSVYTNQQSAIQTVEALGFKFEKIIGGGDF
jgi:hypothetical protein